MPGLRDQTPGEFAMLTLERAGSKKTGVRLKVFRLKTEGEWAEGVQTEVFRNTSW